MAFVAPLVAGPFGNLALAGIGIGLQLAAAYFFPQKIEGPRAESLKAQTSKYGDQIARIHGTAITAGAVIWLKGNKIDEVRKSDREGSIGPITVSYTYTSTCAIAFDWTGPATAIIRMKADGKLIFDMSADTFAAAVAGDPIAGQGLAEGATFTFYLGTDNQPSDPDYAADVGAGLASAWPGLVYVVMRNFPLDEFGQRVPNFEAEVVKAADAAVTQSVTPSGAAGTFDTDGDIMASVSGTALKIHELPSGALRHTVTLPAAAGNYVYITPLGDVLVSSSVPGSLYRVSAASGTLVKTYVLAPVHGYPFGTPIQQISSRIGLIDGQPATAIYVLIGNNLFSIIDDVVGSEKLDISVTEPIIAMTLGAERLWGIQSDGGNYVVRSWDYAFVVSPVIAASTSYEEADFDSLTGTFKGIHYHATSDTLLIVTTTGLFVYDEQTLALLGQRLGDFSLNASPALNPRLVSGTNSIIIRDDGSNNVYEFQMPGLGLVQTVLAASTTWTDKGNSSVNQTAINAKWRALVVAGGAAPRIWFMPRQPRGSVTLASVVAAECALAGVACNVSGLTGNVRGYAVRDAAAPRGVIEDLMRVKFFDFAQVDGSLKFFMRSTASAASLTRDMEGFSADEQKPYFVKEEYADARDLPARAVINYPSLDGDYRGGSQSISGPQGADETATPLQYQTSLVMTDDEAAQACEILFDEARDVVQVYRTGVGPAFLKLHPGDVVTLELDDGRAAKAVVTRQEGEAAIALDLHRRSCTYSSAAVGGATPLTVNSLLASARSGAVFIDGHLFRAADDGDSFYAGVHARESGRFNSATIFRSNDGSNYNPWLGFPNAALVGIAIAALPATAHPFSMDYASSFTFHVASRTGVPNLPSSVTEDALMKDPELNGFAIAAGREWEYVRAATVIDNGDGTWTVSTLLRGLKGTDFACGLHAAGDAVVYLDKAALDRAPEGEPGFTRSYVPVTTSRAFDINQAFSFRNRGRGRRCWAPVGIAGVRDGSGNLTVSFNRRDRLGQDWPDDGPEDPPMSETAESYSLYIYNGPALLRTITAAVGSIAYTAAQQTTDFGSPQAAIAIGTAQMSSTFGAGAERLATV